MSTSSKEILQKIADNIGRVVGSSAQKMVEMNVAQLGVHATSELAKSVGDSDDVRSKRLKALYTTVSVFKDNFSDDGKSVNVPVYVEDTTALKDKSSTEQSPLKGANANPNDESAFENGFVAKVLELGASLQSTVDNLNKAAEGIGKGDDEETEKAKKPAFPGAAKPFGAKDDDADKAKKADDEDEAEKAKKAAEAEDTEKAKGPPAFLKDKEKEDDDTEKAKAKKADDIEEGDDATKAATTKVDKSIPLVDVDKDGTAWPADLNQPTAEKLTWGRD